MFLIGCVPAREEDRHGIPYAPKNLHEYVVGECSICHMPVYVGPESLKMQEAGHGFVVCMTCATRMAGEDAVPVTQKEFQDTLRNAHVSKN